MKPGLIARIAGALRPDRDYSVLFWDKVARKLRITHPDNTSDELERVSRKGEAGGYPSLDSTGKVPASQLPAASGGGLATPAASGLVAVDIGTGTTYGRTIAGTSPVTVTNGNGVSDNPTIAVNAATTTTAGVVELATDGETSAGVVVQGNDSRLSNSRAPSGAAGGDLGGIYPNPTVTQARGLRETAGPTTLPIGAIAEGEVLVRSGGAVIGRVYSEGFDGFFEEMAGSGITGNVTFDGSSAVTGWALASRIYTLSAVTTGVEFDTLTIDTTGGDVTLIPKGMPLYGLALALLGSGTVYFDWSGSDASGITAGAGASAVASAPFGAGANGGAGRTTSGNGNNATALSSSYILLAPDPTLTYNGGSCGSATPRNGGADSNYTNVWNSTRYGGLLEVNARGFAQFAAAIYPLQGSPGGGGGALGEGTGGIGTSGAGAGGAGYIRLGFRSISTGSATLVVRANGGDGSSGVNTNNSEEGGGMGGWGGIIYMTALSVTGTNPIQTEAVGGNGGNGDAVAGAHGAGGDGGPGGRILIVTPASMASKFATPNVSGGAKGSTVGTPATAAKDGSAGAYLIREFG